MANESNETQVPNSARVKKLVRDALDLVDYAIESGVKGEGDRPISLEVISTIQQVAAKLHVFGEHEDNAKSASPEITVAELNAFENAYYNLAIALHPVTAQTLRDTDLAPRHVERRLSGSAKGWDVFFRRLSDIVLGSSPAIRFTRVLWIVAIAFSVFVVMADWLLQLTALEGDDSKYKWQRQLLQLLMPWAYGGLGSCVYLLRSAHVYIYQRTFDILRKPEYFNRILLGTIAGGAIILFVNQITGEDGVVIQLSSAALGFLSGYSTDFLFNTIERIIAAILPKVGLDTVARSSPSLKIETPRMDVSMKDLVDRYERADGTAKELYHSLIKRYTQ